MNANIDTEEQFRVAHNKAGKQKRQRPNVARRKGHSLISIIGSSAFSAINRNTPSIISQNARRCLTKEKWIYQNDRINIRKYVGSSKVEGKKNHYSTVRERVRRPERL